MTLQTDPTYVFGSVPATSTCAHDLEGDRHAAAAGRRARRAPGAQPSRASSRIWRACRPYPGTGAARRVYAAAPARRGAGYARRPMRRHALRRRRRRSCCPALHDELATSAARRAGRFGLVTLQAGGASAVYQPEHAASAPVTNPGAQARPYQPRRRKRACAFENGGAIGVEMMRGDINAHRDRHRDPRRGNRLVAFGHPMMNAGQPALPTCTARVLHVLANERRSFKIAEAARAARHADPGPPGGDRRRHAAQGRQRAAALARHGRARRAAHRVERAAGEQPHDDADARVLRARQRAQRHGVRTTPTWCSRARSRVTRAGPRHHRDARLSATRRSASRSRCRSSSCACSRRSAPRTATRSKTARIEGIERRRSSVRFEADVMMLLDALVPSTEVDPDSDIDVVPDAAALRPGAGDQDRERARAGERGRRKDRHRVRAGQRRATRAARARRTSSRSSTTSARGIRRRRSWSRPSCRARACACAGTSCATCPARRSTRCNSAPTATSRRPSRPSRAPKCRCNTCMTGSARISLDVRREPLR